MWFLVAAVAAAAGFVACDEPEPERAYCVGSDGECFDRLRDECIRQGKPCCSDASLEVEVSSCDAVKEYIVCTAHDGGCDCQHAFDDAQPPTIDCNATRFDPPATCCANHGYPGVGGECFCLTVPFSCDGAVVDDCALAGMQ